MTMPRGGFLGSTAAASALALAACSSAAPTTESSPQSDTQGDGKVTLHVVRHGRTMLNVSDRVQGWCDAVLTPEGAEVVTTAGAGLAAVPFRAAYSSDSGRAVQTAEIILTGNDTAGEVELSRDERLREFGFGGYEGELNETMWTDIADRRGITLEEFHASPDPEAFANDVAALDADLPQEESTWPAEDYATVTARLRAVVDEITERESAHGGGDVLVVSHGLSIQALIDLLFPEHELAPGGITNASVTTIVFEGGEYTLGMVNDTSHLE